MLSRHTGFFSNESGRLSQYVAASEGSLEPTLIYGKVRKYWMKRKTAQMAWTRIAYPSDLLATIQEESRQHTAGATI